MFTGIVEETGFIKGFNRLRGVYRLRVGTAKDLAALKNGGSLSINGVCLTLVGMEKKELLFDVMPETFEKTSFRYLRYNDAVNIERALKFDGTIDGHFVSGHIDSAQKIKALRKGYNPYLDVSIAKNDIAYIVKKGSIAIDGISLTIGEIYPGKIRIFLIPYTLLNTNLKYKKAGSWVNVEYDMLGKYVRNKAFLFA